MESGGGLNFRIEATFWPFRTSNIMHPPMISKCANPSCSKLLMRLDGGRFFGFPTSPKRIEHFWLCLTCSKDYTLKQAQGKVELVRREHRKTA